MSGPAPNKGSYIDDVPWTAGLAYGIDFHSLEWDRRHIRCLSSSGLPYYRWIPFGMPRIPDNVLDVAFYLYSTVEAAEKGEKFGGTGFLVGIKSEVIQGLHYLNAVTNWHVAIRDGFPVIRLNRKDGRSAIWEFDSSDWICLPHLDIAVIALPQPTTEDLQFRYVPDSRFVTRDQAIGVGDDVFMIGRFVDHDGIATNKPAARFGNVSVMPAPIMQCNGVMADSYCLDMRSRTGFSGSPVFVYSNMLNELTERGKLPRKPFVSLLGIHWGQFPVDDTKEMSESERLHSALITTGQNIKELSGMTCVLPAWNILEVLMKKELVEKRREDEERLKRGRKQPVPESASKTKRKAGAMRDALLKKMLETPPKPHGK